MKKLKIAPDLHTYESQHGGQEAHQKEDHRAASHRFNRVSNRLLRLNAFGLSAFIAACFQLVHFLIKIVGVPSSAFPSS